MNHDEREEAQLAHLMLGLGPLGLQLGGSELRPQLLHLCSTTPPGVSLHAALQGKEGWWTRGDVLASFGTAAEEDAIIVMWVKGWGGGGAGGLGGGQMD